MQTFQQFKDDLAIELYGMTAAQAHERFICICCEKSPDFFTAEGENEYWISGLCEPCFDRITSEE